VYLAGVPDEKLQRSSRMADPQDQPENAPEHATGAGPTPPAPPTPPADTAPPKPPEHAAEMSTPPATAPDKPAKKTPAKKAPAKAAKKAAPKKAAAKKAAANKAPAKKAPAKKAPAKKAEPDAAKPNSQPVTPPRIETNGQLAAAAKDAAAHAKSTVDAASIPVSGEAGQPSAARSPLPLAVAIAISLLALLLVRQLRRRDS
jgi:hypothetical protein